MIKTVLVSGASRGIGRAIAKVFAKNNYRVIVNYNKSYDEACSLRDELHGLDVHLIQADVSDINQVNQMFNTINNLYGGIDILVNNAGMAMYKMIIDTTCEDWKNIMDTNLTSVFYLCCQALPNMIKNKRGKIINISSVWGLKGASCESAYSVTKSGIIGLTKSLSKEYAPCNIQVNSIAPGVIDTDMLLSFSKDEIRELIDEIPAMRLGRPQEVAELALFLASDRADYITGQVIGVDGGFN